MDDVGQPPEQAATRMITCPGCNAPVDPASATGPVLECPSCHQQFFIPPEESEDDVDGGNASDPADEAQKESELSALRIRHLVAERRHLYRARAYRIIGALICAMAVAKLVSMGIADFHKYHRLRWSIIADAILTIAALRGMAEFIKRAAAFQKTIDEAIEARRREEEEFARLHPPEFSQLSDGSQHAQNLATMLARGGEMSESGQDNTPGS